MDSRAQMERVFAPISSETGRVGKVVLDAAYHVHTALGPGLNEWLYKDSFVILGAPGV
jgi:hypothetical protein